MKDAVGEKMAGKDAWRPAKWEDEEGEFERVAADEGVPLKALKQAFKNHAVEELTDDQWAGLENTDSWETDSFDKVHKLAVEYDKNLNYVIHQFGSPKQKVEMSIVLKRKDGSTTLVAGNTRLMMARALGVRPKVMVVDLGKKG